jgi:hypothetical protein
MGRDALERCGIELVHRGDKLVRRDVGCRYGSFEDALFL